MVLCGAVIMPHGALILEPERPELHAAGIATKAKNLHDACVTAAAAAKDAKPDVIVLYTPHGMVGDASMNVYTNPSARGSCEWMGDWAGFEVDVAMDVDAAKSLIAKFREFGCDAAPISAFSSMPAPLRWGETVPLYYMRDVTMSSSATAAVATANASNGNGRRSGTKAKVVVLSHGPSNTLARGQTAMAREEETATAGRALASWCEEQEQRVLLLISADLSHVWGNLSCPVLADGSLDPRYANTAYNTDKPQPSAAPFEAALDRWLEHTAAGKNDLARTALCGDALLLLPDARCCGWDGFRMLLEVIERVPADVSHRARLLAHEAPVYFGMLVAMFMLPPPSVTPASAAAASLAMPRRSWFAKPAGMSAMRGKVAAITGAGHGFGAEIVLSLIALGVTVFAVDGPEDSDRVRAELAVLKRRASELPAAGELHTHAASFLSEEEVRAWASTLGPRLDILVLNAGGVLGNMAQPIEDVSMKSWDDIFAVNVRSSFVIVQTLAKKLKTSPAGRIVTISSGAGVRSSLTGIQAYCSAKHAVVGLTRQLARDLGKFGVTVNSVAPGLCLTNPDARAQWESYTKERQDQILSGTALRRLGCASDIADAVLFFASGASEWVTGQILEVNGGGR